MSNSTSREHDLVEMAQKAREAFPHYGNCAQASFAVLQEEFNLDHADILKASGPFPGIALRGETCGAVIGCLMSLGLIFGSDKLEDWWETSFPLHESSAAYLSTNTEPLRAGTFWKPNWGASAISPIRKMWLSGSLLGGPKCVPKL